MTVSTLGFLGMRGTGDWVTDQRPKHWREKILQLYPNGRAPLTAILSKMRSEKVDDPEFNWWERPFPSQGGAITAVYTDDDLSVPYTADNAAAGTTLYIKLAEAVAKEFKAGHIVLLRKLDVANGGASEDLDVDVVAKVTAVTINGASSFLTIVTREADDNSPTNGISDCDYIQIIGSSHEEGADTPNPVAYDPTKIYNYTQIFRNSLEMTRTAQRTRLRTGDAYLQAKRDCLELHSVEMEMATLFGIPTETTGSVEGKPERTTGGIRWFINNYASANRCNFKSDGGGTWAANGEDWLDEKFEVIARYANPADTLILAGSEAVLGINRLAKLSGQFQLSSATKAYGIRVNEWVTPWGTWNMITHPLFSRNQQLRRCLVGTTPKNILSRIIDDTMFKENRQGRGEDGRKDEYLTELGFELHFPETFFWFDNVGQDA